MSLRQSLLSAILTLSLGAWFVCVQAEEKATTFTLQVAAFPESSENEAEEFAAKLTASGEQPIWGQVEIPGKGQWTRVFIGSFASPVQARQYGERLIARRLIKEFVIKKSSEIKMLSRPRSVGRKKDRALQIGGTVSLMENSFSASVRVEKTDIKESAKLPAEHRVKPPPENLRPPSESARPPSVPTPTSPAPKTQKLSPPKLPNASPSQFSKRQRAKFCATRADGSRESHERSSARYLRRSQTAAPADFAESVGRQFAAPRGAKFCHREDLHACHLALCREFAAVENQPRSFTQLAPAPEFDTIPRADPVQMALHLLANSSHKKAPSSNNGGLWLSGDREEGLARLQWIVGKPSSALISLDADGKVNVNARLLAESAKLKETDPNIAPFVMLDYLSANEGLLLLVQMTRGAYRYRLHLGRQASTAGGDVAVQGSVNLDNNFDSRINPYRRLSRKMAIERPPFGFDALIAINPEARWFNLPTNRLVQVGHITFHELVEAYAKVELGYEYLPTMAFPGAHNVALEREMRLKEQRPFANLVLTVGSNRMLKSEDELRQFYAETGAARQQ